MRAVVIGSGAISDYKYISGKIHKDDYIICADGGYNHAKKMGLVPNAVIGDFDSARDVKDNEKTIEYPTRKDYTDGELAVRYALDNGFTSIALVGMTGDRLDHTLCDIFLLSLIPNGVLYDDNNEIYLVKDKLSINGRKGQTVSIVPVNGDAEGIVTEGLEYPLKNETLCFSQSRGISNIMTENKCTVSIKKGMVLVIKVEEA